MTRFLAALFLISVALGLAAPAAFSESAWTEAPTIRKSFGFPGTKSHRDLCNTGEYLIGVVLRAGLWWDQVQIACAAPLPDGTLGPVHRREEPRGGNGGKLPTLFRCDGATSVVVSATITLTKNSEVSYVELGCTSTPHAPTKIDARRTDGREFTGAPRQTQQCNVGEAATGFEIHYSQYVNALGLVCHPFRGQAAPQVVVAKPVPCPPTEELIDGKCQLSAANKAYAEQRADEVKVTGKTAAQCVKSNATCEARAWQFGPKGSAGHIGYVATECQPYFLQCMANAPKAEADAAEARQALERQIADERTVTGKTVGQCVQSNSICEARFLGQLGPINSIGVIASQCRPFFLQCMANAQAAAAGANANNDTPATVPVPTGNNTPTTSICGLPGGPASVAPPKGVNAVNVREAPNGDILKRLARGTKVDIVGGCGDQIAAGIVAPRPEQNGGQKPVLGWCAISSPVIGCVAEQFLTAGFPAADIEEPEPRHDNFDPDGGRPDGRTARVIKDANVRTGPSSSNTKVIAQLHHGIKVGVRECKPSWCRVTFSGNRQGWVSRNFLRFEDNGGFDHDAPQFEPQPDVADGDGQPTTSRCNIPGGTATVSIPQANVNDLNVRKVPNGKIIGRIPEGSQVNVVGGCGEQFAAGIVAQKPAGNGGQGVVDGWCAITSPMVGCVSENFLVAGIPTGDLAPAAGIVAPSDAVERSFTGTWQATAQGASYTMTLEHNGNSVSGSYDASDGSSGTINGRVRNNVLRFSWQQDGMAGSGKFALSDDANSFRGSFSFGDNPDVSEGSWNGQRMQ